MGIHLKIKLEVKKNFSGFCNVSIFSKFIIIKTGEKKAMFLSKAAIDMINDIKIKGFTYLFVIILHQSPIEKKIIKYVIALKGSVLLNVKREQKRLIKKFSKNKSI